MTARDIFIETFGAEPKATGRAPGRVNLIGEHVDYNGGTVLPTAMSSFADVAISPNGADTHSIVSPKFGDAVHRAPGTPKQGDWADYAMGALETASKLGCLDGSVNLAINSTVPDGAGLSSSAALITAVLRAACDLSGKTIEPEKLAHAARAVENDYIGVPCGIMDQMAVGFCQLGEALALHTVDGSYQTIAIPPDWAFLVFHSGVHRKLSDGRYEMRFKECEEAKRLLSTEHLSLLSDDQLKAADALPDNILARVRHVVSDHRRTLAAIDAMKTADATSLADLLNESHASYSQDFDASTPEIDALVNSAVTQGVLGARLTGGGFGGCIVTFVLKKDAEAVAARILSANPDARLIT